MNKTTSEGVESTPTRPIYNKEGNFKICLTAISVIIAVFTGVFFATAFDTESMYFKNASHSYILCGAVAAAAILAIVLSIASRSKLSPVKRRGTTFLQYFSAIILFLFFLQSIISKSFWLVIFSMIAIAYLLGLFYKHVIANTVLGIGSVLFFAATIAQTYFDYSIAVNSPYKLLCQFGMAISMFLIVNELRFELGDKKPRAYKTFSALTFILNVSASAASVTLVMLDTAKINYYFIPCAAMAIYSAKIFFALPTTATESQNTDTTPDEKGTDTDEIVN